MIGKGHESQGLYLLSIPTPHVAFTSAVSYELLHSQLGHPSLLKLQKMVPSLSNSSLLECDSCQLRKHTRTSFPKRINNRATAMFDIVHSNIWGPSHVNSSLGFHYFVIFVDDYSRCTWLFLMKNRSELFSIFQKFCAEIRNQFGCSIKKLISDNAREYFSTPLSSFMSSQGILHLSSCSHTPQQNVVAERKNRHLIETARTLLIHNHVPLRFWGDAVITTCYVINRMPSSILQYQSPHSVLYPDQNLFPLPPRVFGCTCFVHNLTPGKDKLQHKAFKCVFLGYSCLQKGYKCFDPSTNNYFISGMLLFSRLLHIFLLIPKTKRSYQSFRFQPFQPQLHLRLLRSIHGGLNLLLKLLIQLVFLTLIQVHKAILVTRYLLQHCPLLRSSTYQMIFPLLFAKVLEQLLIKLPFMLI